jgi:hypothetical protein
LRRYPIGALQKPADARLTPIAAKRQPSDATNTRFRQQRHTPETNRAMHQEQPDSIQSKHRQSRFAGISPTAGRYSNNVNKRSSKQSRRRLTPTEKHRKPGNAFRRRKSATDGRGYEVLDGTINELDWLDENKSATLSSVHNWVSKLRRLTVRLLSPRI